MSKPEQQSPDQSNPDQPSRDVEVQRGDAVVPDSADAPRKDDLVPEDPPDALPAEGDPDATSAVAPPIPAHGEMASPELIREATRAAEEEDEKA